MMEIVNQTDEPVDVVIRPQSFKEAVVAILEEQIRPLLPAACAGGLISLLVRVPGEPESDLLLTADSYPEMAYLLDRSAARENLTSAADPATELAAEARLRQRDWSVEVPGTDEEALQAIAFGKPAGVYIPAQGIFRAQRAKGQTVRDSYEAALLAIVDEMRLTAAPDQE